MYQLCFCYKIIWHFYTVWHILKQFGICCVCGFGNTKPNLGPNLTKVLD